MNLDRLVWIDIETSGLDPGAGHILELGIIVTTRDLTETDRRSWVISAPRSTAGEGLFMGSLGALRMHAKSGLLDESAESDVDQGRAELLAVGFLNAIRPHGIGTPMCGASVHFDRAWLRKWMPRLHDCFHYRNLDVSTFKILAELVGAPLPDKREAHRVIPDLEDAIALARWARDRFGVLR